MPSTTNPHGSAPLGFGESEPPGPKFGVHFTQPKYIPALMEPEINLTSDGCSNQLTMKTGRITGLREADRRVVVSTRANNHFQGGQS
jgi:hypothetical protein